MERLRRGTGLATGIREYDETDAALGVGEVMRLIDEMRPCAGVLTVELTTRSTVRAVDEVVADMKLVLRRSGPGVGASPMSSEGFADDREVSDDEKDERWLVGGFAGVK